MLGYFRFLLASLVAVSHLWEPALFRYGSQAVVCFYMLSGYLMTTVVRDVYGHSAAGFGRYIANRALRIYPIYWLILLCAALLAALDPSSAASPNNAIRLPETLYDWFCNLTLYSMHTTDVRLIPPSWSLTVEVIFYLLIGLFFARSFRLSLVWFAASLLYTGYMLLHDYPFGARYTPPQAASLFFSAGSMLYWLKDRIAFRPKPIIAALLFALFTASSHLAEAAGLSRLHTGYYLSMAIGAAIILYAHDNKAFSPRVRWADRFLGALAYPLFLLHFFCAGLGLALFDGLRIRSLTHFLIAYALSVALSVLAHLAVEGYINRLRDHVRNRPVLARREEANMDSFFKHM